MKCVVCNNQVAEGCAAYANAWEQSRKRFPCCGAACAGAFNVDTHWIPAIMPEVASDEDQHRLLSVVRQRLIDGDTPSVVLHEMLLAGVSPMGLRKQLNDAFVATDSSKKTARQLSIIGLVTGTWWRSGDKRSPDKLESALVDLDRWEARWPETP